MTRCQATANDSTLTLPTREGPRFFYGWVMLPISMAGMIATAPGQTFSVSVFNDSFRESLNLTHTQLTGAYMLGTFLASLPMAWVGALMDRYGPRRTMTGVVLLLGLACLLTAQVTGLVTIFLAFLLLRMLGQGALGLLSNNTLALWFNRRLGRVSGLRQMGMAGAIAVIPGINLWLIQAYGWRWAFTILGLGVWVLMLPLLAFFFRNRPEDLGQTPDGLPVNLASDDEDDDTPAPYEPTFTLGQAMRTRAYWIVAGAIAMWAMLATAIFFNLVPILEARGFTATDAAATFTTFAITLALMQLIGGFLADFLPLNLLLAVATAGMALAMLILRSVSDLWMVHLFAVSMGAAQGLMASVGAPLWVRYYGREHLGKIRGSLATVMVAASSVGPFIVGLAHDLFHGYQQVLLLFVFLPLPLAALALLATPPAPVTPEPSAAAIP